MAFPTIKISLGAEDTVLISASPIPEMRNPLSGCKRAGRGREVIYESLAEIHVSGHACREELQIMLGL